jgi:hypothetical protein
MSFNQKHILVMQAELIAKGREACKLISLEGGTAHVFRTVAGNHRRDPKNRIMIAFGPSESYFVDEFIIRVCAHLRSIFDNIN